MSNGFWLTKLVFIGFSVCWIQNEGKNVNSDSLEESWLKRIALLSQEKNLGHPKTLPKPVNTRPALKNYYKTILSGFDGDDNGQYQPVCLNPYFIPKGWESYQNPSFFTTQEPRQVTTKTPISSKTRKDVFDLSAYLNRWKEKPPHRKLSAPRIVDSAPVKLWKNSTTGRNFQSHPISTTEEPFCDSDESSDSISRVLTDPESVISIQELLLQGIRNNNQDGQVKPILFQPSRLKHPWRCDQPEQNDTNQPETTSTPIPISTTPFDRITKETTEGEPVNLTTCCVFVNISGNNLTNVNQSWVVYVSTGAGSNSSLMHERDLMNDTKPPVNAWVISKLQELERSLIEMEIEVQKSKRKIAVLEEESSSPKRRRPAKNPSRDLSRDWCPVRGRQELRRKTSLPRMSRWWVKTRPQDGLWPLEVLQSHHSPQSDEPPVEDKLKLSESQAEVDIIPQNETIPEETEENVSSTQPTPTE